jgi:pantoate--beta-alanine ligase
MREIVTAAEVGAATRDARCAGQRIGLVPTMGYLHAGHLALAEAARAETDLVVMSLYVNPTQFGPNEDFERYPRDIERDRALAAHSGVDILFAPSPEVMYPAGPEKQRIWVESGPLAAHLCGASRPGHFRGVTTVVTKLFHLVRPDRAYFGQKDGQQAAIIRRMARDLAFPIEIRVLPTVREADGLALSSRNVYLSPDERTQAPALNAALRWAAERINQGERDPRALEAGMRALIVERAPLVRIDYITVADLDTLQPATEPIGDVLIALAAYFGNTRLIDNILVRFEDGEPHIS